MRGSFIKSRKKVSDSTTASFNQSGEVPEVVTIETESDLNNLPKQFITIGGGSNIVIGKYWLTYN